ncbi:hypothetical protein [Celeribacter sp. SCSIO 80788]|uniref:hypothetical protein n=1 Tax=Celeribacter sp. SCSIO 80788 TaxID=3117013 RepID=UPI003DA4BE78
MNLRDELRAQVGPKNYISDLCGRAADEIVRLRAELAAANERAASYKAWDFPADLQAMAVRAEAAEAREAKLREGITLIERVYYMEGKDAKWRAAHMNGVARALQDDDDLSQYHRLFPRDALSEKGGE